MTAVPDDGGGERWQVSGSAAEKYERFVASWFAAWAEDLVARSGVGPGAQVLDVACGTGVVARALAPVVGPAGSIVATDLNDGMLAEARRHPIDGPAIEWRPADAAALPFDDGRFDAVFCQQGLQFVPDKAAAVAEAARVLRPGGVAAVAVWHGAERNPYVAALADGLELHVSHDVATVMRAPCAFGDPAALAALFEVAGFATVEVQAVTLAREPVDPADAIAGNLLALPVADRIQTMAPGARAALIDDIVERLGSYIVDDRLVVPSTSNVVIAAR
jgi:SAM-dependent methyltransferase